MFKTRMERVELAVCVLVASAVYFFQSWFPPETSWANLILVSACLLLAQGLIRDVWLLRTHAHRSDARERRVAACICAESTFGGVGVVVGLAMLVFGVNPTVVFDAIYWPGILFAVLVIGVAMKDIVITLQPLGLAREPDHINVVFGWKRRGATREDLLQ